MDKPALNRYEGDFVGWNGGAAFLGMGGGAISPHSHYAIQLVLGAPSGLRVQFGRHGAWHSCSAALIPSRATHSIDVSDCQWSAVVFVEPESPEGRALSARLQGQPEMLDEAEVAIVSARLETAWRKDGSRESVQALCLEHVRQLSETAVRAPSDPRVLAAVEHIRQRIDQRITLGEIAQKVSLSPGRFRHLFVEETGMPLRTYVLWRRLLQVWDTPDGR